jgi:hypothetical protein
MPFDLDGLLEGEGGRVANDPSGSRRARLAAGGDIGGERMGEREGEAMAAILPLLCTLGSQLP